MRLSLKERRRLMTQQARRMVTHYNETEQDRQIWQIGDFVDDY